MSELDYGSDVYFGKVGAPSVDWRGSEITKDDDPDDEQIETPDDVIGVLGFDPAKEFSDDEAEAEPTPIKRSTPHGTALEPTHQHDRLPGSGAVQSAAESKGGGERSAADVAAQPAGSVESGKSVSAQAAKQPDRAAGDDAIVVDPDGSGDGSVQGAGARIGDAAADGSKVALISHRALMLGEMDCACGHHHKAPPESPVGSADDTVREDEAESLIIALAREMAAIFAEQRDALLRALGIREGKATPGRGRVKIGASKEQIERALRELANANTEMAVRLESIIGQMLQRGGQAGLDNIGVEGAFNVTNPRVAQYINDYAIRLAGDVNTTSVARLSRTLGEGLDAGETIRQLESRVRQTFDDFSQTRAETIARTESARAYVRGEELGWEESGVVQGKQWLISADACEYCRAIAKAFEGKAVPLGSAFIKQGTVLQGAEGGSMLLDYEDIQGAPLHPKCRCDLIAVTELSGGRETPKA